MARSSLCQAPTVGMEDATKPFMRAASVWFGLLVVGAVGSCGCARGRADTPPPAAATSEDRAEPAPCPSPAAAAPAGIRPEIVETEMRNVDLHLAEGVVLSIHALRG